MAYLICNQDVDHIDMNQLVSTLKYKLLLYMYNNKVHNKLNSDQLHRK
jgi:hypothetical protein